MRSSMGCGGLTWSPPTQRITGEVNVALTVELVPVSSAVSSF